MAAEEKEESWSFEELSLLNEKKILLQKEHQDYIQKHPELQTLLSSFLTAVLLEKPSNVLEFSKDHFQNIGKIILKPLVIAGPSGVGKGTLIDKLLKEFPNAFGFSVSQTTRQPRPGEVDGVAYHFTTQEAMEKEIGNGNFLEYANVHGNLYGTSRNAVQFVQENQKKICILDIDIQGVEQVKKVSGVQGKFIFIAPPSMESLEKRLRDRGTETEEKIQLRLKNAKMECAQAQDEDLNLFDHILINEELIQAYDKLKQLILKWYPQYQNFT